MFYVYILKSKKDNKLYVGYTPDLKKRLSEHQKGNVESTRPRLPLELVYYESYKNKKDAVDREQSFKKSGSVYNGLVKRIKRSLETGD